MVTRKTRQNCCCLLLATAVAWLVSVTLCSTKTVAETPHETESHTHEIPGAAHHDHTDGCDTCGCESIHVFPSLDLYSSPAKAPVPTPAVPAFSFLFAAEIFCGSQPILAVHRQSTGPPERLSFAELVLHSCLPSQAPPHSA